MLLWPELTVLVDDGPCVVQAEDDHVEHERHVHAPVNTVTVSVDTRNQHLAHEQHAQIAPAQHAQNVIA